MALPSLTKREQDKILLKGDPATVLIPSVRKAIVDAIARGARIDMACAIAGIRYETYKKAMQKAQVQLDYIEEYNEPHTYLTLFYLEVHKAKAERALQRFAKLEGAVDRDAKAYGGLTWVMEQDEDFARRQAIQVKQDTTVEVRITKVDRMTQAIVDDTVNKAIESGDNIIESEYEEEVVDEAD